MNDYEYYSNLLQNAYATSSFSDFAKQFPTDFAKQFPMTANEIEPKDWNVEGPVSERNQLTQRQTMALIKLWEKWKPAGNLTLNRLAYSPYGSPYITIVRRDDLRDKKFKWDWSISYHGKPDGRGIQITWYSDLKESMPDEIRTFLREAYDKEFVSKLD